MIPRRVPLAIALALLSVVVAAAQEEAPPPGEILEFAVGAELVRIDVVVTDKDDRPVSSLAPEDFVILEDNEPQEIAHFEVYRRRQQVLAPDDPEPVATASAEEVEGYRRRHIVFAVDDIHMEPGNLSLAKEAMLRFVDEQIGPEDRVALVATSGSHGMYQEFTNDPWVLRLAISRVTPQLIRTDWAGPPQLTQYQAELIERGDPLALELAVQEILREQPPGASRAVAEVNARTRARAVRSETVHYVRTTLETLDNVMRGLAELPGRKVIVLVSDGFLMGLGTANVQAFDLRRITDAGTRAGVVVYAMDTRGLMTGMPVVNAAVRGSSPMVAPGAREAMARQGEEAVRDGMSGLAKDTGGFFVYNTNDFRAGLDRILQDTETYFLLAYQPTNTKRDGRFRRIKVDLPGRDDLEVRTRRGYFAPDDREDSKPPPRAEESGKLAANDLQAALASLYPRSAIPVHLSADFVSLGAAGPQLVVNANVDLTAVRFEHVGDRHLGAVVLAGVVYDAAGAPFTNLEPQRVDLGLEGPDYDQARKVGLKYKKALSLTPGAYEVRFAVRDDGSRRLGSASQWVEIPDVDGGRLTLSDVFLLRGAAVVSTEEIANGGSGAQLQDVQAYPRFERTDSLVYQLQVLNPNTNASGDTELTIQAHVLEGDRLLASTPETPVLLSQMGVVPQAYTGRIKLEPLRPGEYDLQVAVTDHLVRSTLLKRIAFTVQP
jgi:VWFA-related protein